MSNLGGTTFKFVYANRHRMSKQYTNIYMKDEESPPDYNTLTDVVTCDADNE